MDVYEVRREIEALAIRRFNGAYSPMELAILEMTLAETSEVQDTDCDEIFRTSRDFHLALVGPLTQQVSTAITARNLGKPSSTSHHSFRQK